MSSSGTTPGTELPGNATLPLNLDDVTRFVYKVSNTPVFENFIGWLDGAGTAQATLRVKRGELRDIIGFKFYFAFVTVPVTGYGSNAVSLQGRAVAHEPLP